MKESRSSPLARVVRLVGGGVLITVGLAGLILPVMPGWIFIIPGLGLWSTEFVWAARLRQRASDQWKRRRAKSPTPSDPD